MEKGPSRIALLIYVLVASSCVYILANREAFTNPYLINDDVRQQIYWMQQWQDPELFRDDPLTEYSKEYVPTGIKLIYRAASPFVSPVRFSNILTGILFVVTAGFLFGLGLEFRDDLTAVLVVCVFLLFGGFLGKMAGGLSRTFVWPLLTAYLFFIVRNRPGAAGTVILAASILNPYTFLLCFFTHAIFLLHNYGKDLAGCLATEGRNLAGKVRAWAVGCPSHTTEDPLGHNPSLSREVGSNERDLSTPFHKCGYESEDPSPALSQREAEKEPSPQPSPRGRGRNNPLAPASGERVRVRGGLYGWPIRSIEAGIRNAQPSPRNGVLGAVLLWNVPVLIGLLVIFVGHVILPTNSFGTLVTRADMAGMVEYTEQGRYLIQPVPSFVYELIRPWIFNLPFREWGAVAGWASVCLLIASAVFALGNRRPVVSFAGFRVFCYLAPASLILYVLACIFLMKLFVPRRYLEYSLNLFYCMGTAVCLRAAIERLQWRRIAFPLLTTILVLFAIVRLHNLELYDYSEQEDLYGFLQSTPKSVLIAGHPELMDNIPTFAKRKAFVTYELSHTWIQPYWNTMKERTFDLFSAYYSDNPEVIRDFCRKYGITYLIVRDEDFSFEGPVKDRIYFEPFERYIRNLVGVRRSFAILDTDNFPPVYQKKGIRVLKIE